MLRMIAIYSMIIFLFVISPHGQQTVYAVGNSSDQNTVSKCISSPELCAKAVPKKAKESSRPANGVGNSFSFFTFVKMILALLFVLFLIYFLLKLVNKKANLFNPYRSIQNVGGTSLGQNRSIQLVKIGNRILVVGVGDSIQLLREIEDDEEIKEILADYNHRLDQLTQSKDHVIKWLKNKTSSMVHADNEQKEFGVLLKEQLKEISKGRKKIYEQLNKKGNKQNE